MSADPFNRTDQLDAAMLDAIAARLENRGRQPAFVEMLQQYLDAMRIEPAASVLDLGCGTGLAARAIARHPGFTGRVTGVDLSPHLVEVAGRLAREEGLAGKTAFRCGDARRLGFADASFDAVIAHTLLSHVADPQAVVCDAARLLKPGGLIGIFDGDYASLTFGNADEQRGRAADQALVGGMVTSPWVMRQMPRILRAAGLELVASFPHVLAEVGRSQFWVAGLDVYRKLMTKAGTMSAQAAEAWAAALLEDDRNGVFFGASNFYAYVARRPL